MRKKRNTVNVKLGKRLRELREDEGISQAAAAKFLGIMRTSLVNIEYGRQNVNAVQLVAFARLYEASVAAIVGDLV